MDAMLNQILIFIEAVNRIFNMLPMDWLYVPLVLSALFVPVRKYRLYKKAESLFKSERFTDFVVVAIILAEVAVDYFANNPDLPAQWVGLQAVVSALAANKGYIYLIKPSYNKLRVSLDPKIQVFKKAAADLAVARVAASAPTKDPEDVMLAPYIDAMQKPSPKDFTQL